MPLTFADDARAHITLTTPRTALRRHTNATHALDSSPSNSVGLFGLVAIGPAWCDAVLRLGNAEEIGVHWRGAVDVVKVSRGLG